MMKRTGAAILPFEDRDEIAFEDFIRDFRWGGVPTSVDQIEVCVDQGASVRVLGGPLAGVEGMFVQDRSSKGRLVVSVDMLGRSIAIEMDASDVEPCAPAHSRRQHAGGARGDRRG